MKEATSELNITVIVAISIGILSAFFFGIIWPAINHNFKANTQCNQAICICDKETREQVEAQTGRKSSCKCALNKTDLSSDDKVFYCPFKG